MTQINNLSELLEWFGVETPYQLGRALYKYTDCGPWTAFVVPGRESVYYNSELANQPIPKCTGVEIGSIVEGYDGDGVGPFTLTFPFTSEQLDQTVKEVNDQASVVWEWANVPKDILGRRHRHGKTDEERGLDYPLF